MLNRRLIRIKIFQALYAHFQSENSSKEASRKFLLRSLTGIEKTFNAIVIFPFELSHWVKTTQNPENKYITTAESEAAYNLMANNPALDKLAANPVFEKALSKPVINWFNENDFLQLMYKKIMQHEKFKTLCTLENTFDNQWAFISWVYDYLLEESEDFDQKMEEIEMHWDDEKYPIKHSLKKILSGVTSLEDISQLSFPALSKDLEDDMAFSEKLLNSAIIHADEYESLIASRTPGWDKERIARADIILMVMAVTEFIEFPNIPVKASMNEYLELAKLYSTPQSSKFINGILDKLLKDLQAENKIVKKGRGLLG